MYQSTCLKLKKTTFKRKQKQEKTRIINNGIDKDVKKLTLHSNISQTSRCQKLHIDQITIKQYIYPFKRGKNQ